MARLCMSSVLLVALTVNAQFFDVFQRNPINIQNYDGQPRLTQSFTRSKPVSPVSYEINRDNHQSIDNRQTAVLPTRHENSSHLTKKSDEILEPSSHANVGTEFTDRNRMSSNHRRRLPSQVIQSTHNYYQIDNITRKPTRKTTRNPYESNNPYLNRPGVKPAAIENDTPFTNKPVVRPVTQRPKPRPVDTDAIMFPEDPNDSPQIISGHDEDYMSEVDKRRYIEVADRMCDKYKAMGTKQVQAIPLVQFPDPVEVNVSSCPTSSVPLVIGGKVVTINEFPHMALVGWRKVQEGGYSWRCGGSLVSSQFVLTAAHCSFLDRDNSVQSQVPNYDGKSIIDGPPTAVQLGSSYLDDIGALVIKITAIIRHPKYKPPRSYYDLALAKLAKKVRFSEVIKPACLGTVPPAGRPVIVTGWGKTEFGSQSQELRSVSIPIWDLEECQKVLGTSKKFPYGPSDDSQMCAGEKKGGKDTCEGDSGGPAQVQDGCSWKVVAVTSLGRGCGAPQTPGLYATVHKAFISSHIFENIREVKDDYNKYDDDNDRTINSNDKTNNNNDRANNNNDKIIINNDHRQNYYNNNRRNDNQNIETNLYSINERDFNTDNSNNNDNYKRSNYVYTTVPPVNYNYYENNRQSRERDNYNPQNNNLRQYSHEQNSDGRYIW